MGIVLSHTTAKAVYQTAYSVVSSATGAMDADANTDLIPQNVEIKSAKTWLDRHGVPFDGPLELLVSNAAHRRLSKKCICHVARHEVADAELLKLDQGLFIVSIEECALQAATYLSLPELVEYYFELCGAYAYSTEDPSNYESRPALTSTANLKQHFGQMHQRHGVELARQAIRYVRDKCRSPMETAFVMMLTLPRKFGGLGIRDLETDYEIKVGKVARDLTRRTKFYFDAYLKRSRTDIEYNGFYHDSDENRAIDEERKNALKAMGYEIVTVSRHSFFEKKAFARVMLSIIRREGIRPSRLPEDFFIEQERLRQFVLRRYIEKRRREEEACLKARRERDKAAQENELAMGVEDDPSINEAPELSDMQSVAPFEDPADSDCPTFGSLGGSSI